jgi:hypothetical protein
MGVLGLVLLIGWLLVVADVRGYLTWRRIGAGTWTPASVQRW